MSINYLDKDEWRKFIEDYIVPLRDSANALCNYWNYLKSKINNTEVEKIMENELFKIILLGGTDDEGNYLNNSSAKFYKDFFGISLNVELPKYAIAVKEEATRGIKGTVQEKYSYSWKSTRGNYHMNEIYFFIKFIRDITEQTRKIVNIASYKEIIDTIAESSPAIEHELLADADAVIECIADFLNKCGKIAPNYNKYTLFILSIRSITRRYLEVAYPQFKDKFAELQSLLGLKLLFEPSTESEKRKEYAIWNLPKNSFGGEIRKLYELIWASSRNFKDMLSQYFEGVVDLREEFLRNVKERVSLIPTEIEKFFTNNYYTGEFEFELEKDWIRDSRLHRLHPEFKKKPMHLFKLLDEIIPLVFSGYIDIIHETPERISILRSGEKKICTEE